MKEFSYTIKDPIGLHARPAGLLVKAAAAYHCTMTMTAPNGKADLKRLMAVMRLAVKCGDQVTITCEGEDEDAAASGLLKFFNENV